MGVGSCLQCSPAKEAGSELGEWVEGVEAEVGASREGQDHLVAPVMGSLPHPPRAAFRAAGAGVAFSTGLQARPGWWGPGVGTFEAERMLSAADIFCLARPPVSVFMFSSLTLAVWSTSLRKILAFESCCHNNHFITPQAQYLRNAESFLKSVRCTSKGNGSSLFLHYFAGK